MPRPRERTSELGVSVIVDDTASHRFLRDTWREVAAQGKVRFQIIWLDIDPVTQRHRLQANRSAAARPDVVDRVMAEHRASFEPPLEENAIRVEARNARELETIADLFHSLSTHAGPQA
ncbi:AAA family ATPase [Microbacterium sp. NPDC060132]|uniref:AAA family ATPase n=1 Tax=unclassified Microbacterium TaxID=2609290 RepID=UPI00144432EB|nr:AAA family ATPase [Microbacterium sp. PF5]